MKNFSPTMRDIKMILQKNDLQICRAKRVRWGPYSLGALVPGEVNIMPMTIPLKKKVIDLKNKRLQEVQKDVKSKLMTRESLNLIDSDKKNIKLVLENNKKQITLK